MLGPVAMAGYKGVANTPNSSSKNAYENLRAQSDKSAGNFSGGSAMNSLDKAAADAAQIGSGAGGLGAGGDSEKTTKPSGSTTKYDHNRSGETLAEAAAKARQAKALEWEFFKKYEIPKQLINAVVGAIGTELGKLTSSLVGGVLNPRGAGAPANWCWTRGPSGACYPSSKVSDCGSKDQADLDCKCVWTGPQNGTPPAGAGCAGGTTDPGNDTTNPGNNTPGGNTPQHNVAPATTWPTPAASTFDKQLELLRADISAVEGQGDKPKDFVKGASDVAKKLADLTSLGTRGYEFPFIVGNTKLRADAFQRDRGEFSRKVSATNAAIAQLKTRNSALVRRLEAALKDPAVLKAIGQRKGSVLTQNKIATAEIVTTTTTPEAATIQASIETLKQAAAGDLASATGLEPQGKFLERGASFYDKQAGYVGTAAVGLREKSVVLSEKSQGIGAKLDGYITELEAPGNVPSPETLTQIGEAFKNLTGLPIKVGETDTIPQKQGETSLLKDLLVMRGADEDSYYKSAKVDDSRFTGDDGEKKTWAAISPKNQAAVAKYDAPLESQDLPDEMKVSPVLNMRVADELTDDLKFLSTTAENLDKDVAAVKQRTDKNQADVDKLLGTGTAVTPDPVVTDPVVTDPVVTDPVVTPVVDPQLAKIKSEGNALISAYTGANYKQYPDWPSSFSKTKYAAQYRKHRAAASQIRSLRTRVKAKAQELENAKTPEEARRIVDEIKALTNQIDRKIRVCANAIAEVRRLQKAENQAANDANAVRKQAWEALPKSELHNIRLFKGPIWIPAYNDKGEAITERYCDGTVKVNMIMPNECKPGAWSYSQTARYGSLPGITHNGNGVWRQAQIKIRVPDFNLAYASGIVQARPHRANPYLKEDALDPDNIEPFEISSIKEEQYDMEVHIDCQYSKQSRKWIVSEATLRKGKAQSSDALGGNFSAGWDLGVKLTGQVNYNHVWSHHRFGNTVPYDNMKGKSCSSRAQ
ncbi:MAG: hypothetical protein AUJ51_05260 [Elusimicrobia bacterium CG1_02_56_21]|nr:MAG: hypothetical protein AUJ51_05260 [Elusimicrobia bacterium CG1_02_56_21]